MGGFSFAYRVSGQVPLREHYPLGKNLTGAPTNENLAGGLYRGDPVVLTTATAVTTASAQVVRTVVKDDKDVNYEEGGVRAGILGICVSNMTTNSAGKLTSTQSNGGYRPKVAGMGDLNPFDTNGHSQSTFIIATPDTVFKAKLTTAAASAAAYLALKGALGGLTIPTTDGGTFTVDSTITGEGALFRIVDVDPKDANWLTVFVSVMDSGLSPSGSYCQIKTSTPYITQ